LGVIRRQVFREHGDAAQMDPMLGERGENTGHPPGSARHSEHLERDVLERFSSPIQ
jgi:hypothetical protein